MKKMVVVCNCTIGPISVKDGKSMTFSSRIARRKYINHDEMCNVTIHEKDKRWPVPIKYIDE